MRLSRRIVEFSVRHPREAKILRVVADGAIAMQRVGEGRLFPLVIVDTTARPDIEEYVRIHQHLGPGDVTVQWGQVYGHVNTVALFLTFTRPAEAFAIIEFELTRGHGVLVEQTLGSKGLYIQPGKEGDRLKHDVNRPKIVVEVADTGFGPIFDRLHRTHIRTHLRQAGLGRAEAKRAADHLILEMREFKKIRIGSGSPPSRVPDDTP